MQRASIFIDKNNNFCFKTDEHLVFWKYPPGLAHPKAVLFSEPGYIQLLLEDGTDEWIDLKDLSDNLELEWLSEHYEVEVFS